MSLASFGVVRVAKQERKLRSFFFLNKPICEDNMITNVRSIAKNFTAMKIPRTHLRSLEFVLMRLYHFKSILFILKMITRYVKKLNIIEVITYKNVPNMPYPELRHHPRQVTNAKDKL